MSDILFYGDALHAVLPFLKQHPEVLDNRDSLGNNFERILLTHAPVIFPELVRDWGPGSPERGYILWSWSHIIDRINLYENAWIEPDLRAYAPSDMIGTPLLDLVLIQSNILHLTEVKSVSSARKNPVRLASRQVKRVSEILHPHLGQRYTFEGRVLCFVNDYRIRRHPDWKTISLSTPPIP